MKKLVLVLVTMFVIGLVSCAPKSKSSKSVSDSTVVDSSQLDVTPSDSAQF